MKVLKQGIVPGDITHYTTCTHCKSVLEFQRKETQVVHDQREGAYMRLNCPVCGKALVVDMKGSMRNPLADPPPTWKDV